jgi:WS/DGAT/MGAT family acyltransferase
MTVEPLRAEDVALLCAQPRGAQLQIGALCFFDAAPLRDRRGHLRVAELRAHVESRLQTLPRFRQRIARVLADVSAPMWVDDEDFDVGRHTPHVELAAPGGPAALRAFMADLLSTPMDPAHPLWDIHTIEGAEPDIVAIVVRAHHVMADGLALYEAATLLLDATPQPPRKSTHSWSPEPVDNAFRLSAASLANRTSRQARLATEIVRALFNPRRFAPNACLAAEVIGAARKNGLRNARTFPLARPVGCRRAFAWDALPMTDVLAVKQACDVTVNDVVLAITAGALRRELQALGVFDPDGPDPRALIPIGAPKSDGLALGNRFSVTTVELPIGIDDPLQRVRLLHTRMHQRPPSPFEPLMPHLFSIADVVPVPALRALVPRVLARQPFVDLAITNIPGGHNPLYLWDSRLLRLSPFITGVGNIALIVGVLSYTDTLGIGVTVDPDAVGDPGPILARMRTAAKELADLVR